MKPLKIEVSVLLVLASSLAIGCSGEVGDAAEAPKEPAAEEVVENSEGSAGSDAMTPLTRGTYEEVSAILGGPEIATNGKCAAMSCHGGSSLGKASMNFKTAWDLTEVLVNVPACENNGMMRVAPGEPDSSWLWIKLNADVWDQVDGLLDYDGFPSSCVGVATGFGTRMPQVYGFFEKLSAENLNTIRTWIEDGALGPDGDGPPRLPQGPPCAPGYALSVWPPYFCEFSEPAVAQQMTRFQEDFIRVNDQTFTQQFGPTNTRNVWVSDINVMVDPGMWWLSTAAIYAGIDPMDPEATLAAPFPVGTMLVHIKHRAEEPFGLMMKREEGFDPEQNDWMFARYFHDGSQGSIEPVPGTYGSGPPPTCMSCHIMDGRKDRTDLLWGVPRSSINNK